MTTCPVCELEINDAQLKTCPQCGWDQLNRYYLGLTEEDQQEIQAKLEQARSAWQEKGVVYSPNTPVPELTRDPFEYVEEYRERIIHTQRRPLKAGEGRLIKEKYDIDSGRFPLEVTWLDWIKPLLSEVEVEEWSVTAEREVARSLYQAGPGHPLYAQLELDPTEQPRLSVLELYHPRWTLELAWEGKQKKRAASKPASPGNRFRDPLKSGGQGPEMVVIGPGRFRMGGNGYDWEKPIHEVHIAYPFALGRFPVTFEEYDRYCEHSGRDKPNDQGWGRGRRPVINIYWQEAVNYCRWLSEQTGQEYRLPSEAEWEYACRSGSQGKYCFGDDAGKLGDYAWYKNNSGGHTHPVGEKQPNAWGLYDMHGNVWEWCQDRWHQSYRGAPTDGSAWESGGNSFRLLRGGSWNYNADFCRAACRGNGTNRCSSDGFRVLCVVAART